MERASLTMLFLGLAALTGVSIFGTLKVKADFRQLRASIEKNDTDLGKVNWNLTEKVDELDRQLDETGKKVDELVKILEQRRLEQSVPHDPKSHD